MAGYKSTLAKTLALVVTVAGLGTGIWLTQHQTGFFSRAWGGITTYTQNISGLFSQPQTDLSSLPVQSVSQTLFEKLLTIYPDAEIATISAQTLGISGHAYFKYVPSLNKTFVFSKITGLPTPKIRIARLWISPDQASYRPVGTVEFTSLSGKSAGFSVFVEPGSLQAQKNLVLSYDSSTQVSAPELIIINLDF